MGSEIRLALGRLEIDWGRNHHFFDHLPLFQEGDLGDLRSKRVLTKCLKDVQPRLRLLGHTVDSARDEYEMLRERLGITEALSFEEFAGALKRVKVETTSEDYSYDHSWGRFFTYEIVPRLKLKSAVAEQRDFGEMMENFHPWNTLCLLAERARNLDQLLVWDFSEVVEAGWEAEEDFVPKLDPSNRFLVVTEGSSDAKVLRRALDLLRPSISDFFYFVDMQEGYPFTGTGNLANFSKGLLSIGILNNALIVFDNDAEGISKAKEIAALRRPSNLSVMVLPDLRELERIETIGPTGKSFENINGRAASIEAYLDLTAGAQSSPIVRWSNYVERVGSYQGALVSKDEYVKRFLNLRHKEQSYDFSKLECVLNHIIDSCAKMVCRD